MDSLIREKSHNSTRNNEKIPDARGTEDLRSGGKYESCGLAGWRLVDDGGVGVFGDDGHGGPPLVKGYFSLLMYSMML